MTTGRLLIVMNAGAGHSQAETSRAAIRAVLDSHERAYQFFLADSGSALPQQAALAVQQALAEGGAVIAAGGDGTLNTVAQAVLPHGLPFGVLPLGTFNYFARAHGMPQDITAATEALLSARIQPVQVGLLNERIFLVNASLGLYPTLLEDREAYKAQYGRSRLVALWAGLVTLWRARSRLRIVLEHDGQRRKLRTSMLFVGNNALQLAQLGLPSAQQVEQGALAALALRPTGTLAMLLLLLRGAVGQLHTADKVLHFTFQRISVRPRLPYGRRRIKVATDGEVGWMTAPLVFAVAPQPLQLLCPARAETAA